MAQVWGGEGIHVDAGASKSTLWYRYRKFNKSPPVLIRSQTNEAKKLPRHGRLWQRENGPHCYTGKKTVAVANPVAETVSPDQL